MLKSIENQIERCRQSGRILDVYKAAEIVCSENVFDNVALEDIVDRLVRHAGSTPEWGSVEEIINAAMLDILGDEFVFWKSVAAIRDRRNETLH